MGLWGAPGQSQVAWGDWAHFVAYTAQVNSFLPAGLSSLLATLATAAELTFGVCLVLSWFMAAYGAAVLLLVFALAMMVSLGIKAPLDYSVWAAAGCALLLAAAPAYPWSVDAWRAAGPKRPGSSS